MSYSMIEATTRILNLLDGVADGYWLRFKWYLENAIYNYNISSTGEEKDKFIKDIYKCIIYFNDNLVELAG